MRNYVIAILSVLLMATMAFTYTVHNDIEYYPEGTAPQLDKNMLDIYVPDGATANTPVFFFVHGGTWMYNDRSDFVPIGTNLADDEEFIVVIPSFRLSDSLHPGNVHPCHITDVAQAFAWTVENISDYNGDPGKIFAIGHSSGAHLAALLATNTVYLDSAGANIDDIRGVISLSMGIYDIPKLYYDCGAFGSIGYDMMGFNAIFGPLADSLINWYDASPKYHLSETMPPFLLFVANEDLEWIIGGVFYGMITFEGEIGYCYDDMNVYHATDSFWLEGDHDMILSDFAYYSTCRSRIETMNFVNNILSGIKSDGAVKPVTLELQTYPNPFNSSCMITVDENAMVEIYDLRGNVVATPINMEAQQGITESKESCTMKSTHWCPDESISSGVYLVCATTIDGNTITRKIIYLR